MALINYLQTAEVGATKFASEFLGQLLYIEFPLVGTYFKAGDTVATVVTHRF